MTALSILLVGLLVGQTISPGLEHALETAAGVGSGILGVVRVAEAGTLRSLRA